MGLKQIIAGQFFDQAIKQLETNKEAIVLQITSYPIPDIAALKLIQGESIQDKTANYKLLVQVVAQGIIEDALKDPQKLKAMVLSQL